MAVCVCGLTFDSPASCVLCPQLVVDDSLLRQGERVRQQHCKLVLADYRFRLGRDVDAVVHARTEARQDCVYLPSGLALDQVELPPALTGHDPGDALVVEDLCST